MRKKEVEAVVEVKPIKIKEMEITIKGLSPLIVNNFNEKSKQQILDAQQKKPKTKEIRNPIEDFMRACYWLTPMPEEFTEESFGEAVKMGARFGFPAVSFKKAATSAAYRQGWTKDKVTANGSFWLLGINDPEFVEIETDESPVMREDMVKLNGTTADIRYRGEYKRWKCKCKISYLKDGVFSLENLISMINLGGFSCGIGEWRIEKGGINGAFHVEATN